MFVVSLIFFVIIDVFQVVFCFYDESHSVLSWRLFQIFPRLSVHIGIGLLATSNIPLVLVTDCSSYPPWFIASVVGATVITDDQHHRSSSIDIISSSWLRLSSHRSSFCLCVCIFFWMEDTNTWLTGDPFFSWLTPYKLRKEQSFFIIQPTSETFKSFGSWLKTSIFVSQRRLLPSLSKLKLIN